MRFHSISAAGLLLLAATACTTNPGVTSAGKDSWKTLLDGGSLTGWDQIGEANWRVEDGSVLADKGTGYLVSKSSYANYELRVEVWVDADANSGVFIRCEDARDISPTKCYEVNIFDKRPDQTGGTGSIVGVAKPLMMTKAGGQWNVLEISANGPQLSVTLNGIKTVDAAQDDKHANGPIALQHAAGVVKFRKVQIRSF